MNRTLCQIYITLKHYFCGWNFTENFLIHQWQKKSDRLMNTSYILDPSLIISPIAALWNSLIQQIKKYGLTMLIRRPLCNVYTCIFYGNKKSKIHVHSGLINNLFHFFNKRCTRYLRAVMSFRLTKMFVAPCVLRPRSQWATAFASFDVLPLFNVNSSIEDNGTHLLVISQSQSQSHTVNRHLNLQYSRARLIRTANVRKNRVN